MKTLTPLQRLILTTMMVAVMLPPSLAFAQGNGNGNGNGNSGGGGGGGNDPPLVGQVYFFHDDGVWSMNPDGSMLTRLAANDIGFGDQPSHERHGGERWFTDRESLPVPAYPNGLGASTVRTRKSGRSVNRIREYFCFTSRTWRYFRLQFGCRAINPFRLSPNDGRSTVMEIRRRLSKRGCTWSISTMTRPKTLSVRFSDHSAW